MTWPLRTLPIFVLVVLIALSFATAVHLLSATPYQNPSSSDGQPFTWIINQNALKLLQQAGGQEQIEQYFNNPKTYVTTGKGMIKNVPAASVPTISFTSYTAMQSAFENGQVDPRYKAVIYDSESWEFTPEEEQRDPAKYYALAARLAHQYHLTFIATPAADLVRTLRPNFKGSRYEQFLDLKIAAAAAKEADIFEIQAQGSEADTSLYVSFVTQAAAQAHAANPKVVILAGLSTNPTGQSVSADQLFDAVSQTRNVVSGYWLNIPSGGAYCRTCGKPKPGIAIALLRELNETSHKQ